jgi:hypothetical protein
MFMAFVLGITKNALFAGVIKVIIGFHLAVIDWIAEIPWATVDIPPGNPLIFLIYLPVLAVMILLKIRTKYSYRPSYTLDKIPDYGKIYAC